MSAVNIEVKGSSTKRQHGDHLNAADARDLYRMVVLIRRAEEHLRDLFSNGEVPGFIHLSIGQEAISAGIMSALGAEDTIASTHRGHGHALAKGISVDGFFAELLGRELGLCRGRGGSMHVADMSVGMLGANGIVGAGLSIALGSALAHKTLRRNAIAVAFFGDGALAEGLVHETFNLAMLWKLPVVFICENNNYAMGTSVARSSNVFDIYKLADAYDMPGDSVDGMSPEGVHEAVTRAVKRARTAIEYRRLPREPIEIRGCPAESGLRHTPCKTVSTVWGWGGRCLYTRRIQRWVGS